MFYQDNVFPINAVYSDKTFSAFQFGIVQRIVLRKLKSTLNTHVVKVQNVGG